jgi:AraC family transcriptional activator of pyochelin receptor
MEAIDVSPEMLALVGRGRIGEHRWPSEAIAFEVGFASSHGPWRLTFHRTPVASKLEANAREARLILIVDRRACERVLGAELELEDAAERGLPSELGEIANAIRDCVLPAAAATPYRLAKSIELLCEIMNALREGRLVDDAPVVALTRRDVERVAAARKIIETHWNEKLTLCSIASRCGLNRSKLARGFRLLYNCSVTEALLERRLAEARSQLMSTDLPVGLIGYRSGYQNNASFSRAFCRRFGVPPSDFRARPVAA